MFGTSPDTRGLCTYSDRTVSVWQWRPGCGFVEKAYSPLTHHKYMVTSVHFDGDATVLATSSLDGNTTLCDVEVTPSAAQTFGGNEKNSKKFSADGWVADYFRSFYGYILCV